jgi:hypothetical protein
MLDRLKILDEGSLVRFVLIAGVLALALIVVWSQQATAPPSNRFGVAPSPTSDALFTRTFTMDIHSAPSLSPAKLSAGAAVHTGPAFDGISYSSSLVKNAPPDVQLAVGQAHVVEMVNLQLNVWRKDGSLVEAVDLYRFFGAPSRHYIGDPRLVYDTASGRWLATVFDFNVSSVLLAVSSSGDPTGPWGVCTLPAPPNTAPDQPIIGFSDDKVVISANLFTLPDLGSFKGAYIWVINKAELISGICFHYATLGPFLNVSSLHPMRPYGAAPTLYVACVRYCDAPLAIYRLKGVPPGPVSLTRQGLSIRTPQDPPPAEQQGSSKLLDTGDNRVLDVIYRDGTLWVAFNNGCVPPGDTQMRSCFRLAKVDLTTMAVELDIEVYGSPGTHFFYPAIALDSNSTLYVIFGHSSSSSYPSLSISVLSPGQDSSSLLSSISLLKLGSGPEQTVCGFLSPTNICRYGDYFGASADPSDPGSVWLAGEYGTQEGWATYIARASVGIPKVTLTLSYYVANDGSEPPSPPILSYVFDNRSISVPLSHTPVSYEADYGSPWSVTQVLYSSDGLHAWSTAQNTSGLATVQLSLTIAYYHQVRVNFGYFSNDGSRLPSLVISYSGHGVTEHLSLLSGEGATAWVDVGGNYSYANPVMGDEGERWYSPNAFGIIVEPAPVSAVYYHQYLLVYSYAIQGGGDAGKAQLNGTSLGKSLVALMGPGEALWLDAGTRYTISPLLQGSGALERWVSDAPLEGIIESPVRLSAVYRHQFLVSLAVLPDGAGELSAQGGWYDAGSNITLLARPAQGWAFALWRGSGPGSYSGSSNPVTVSVEGPIRMEALFYAGLTLISSPGGTIGYSYSGGSGSVAAGSNKTIYVPPGESVQLTANPWPLLFSFEGWRGLSSTSASVILTVQGPLSVEASFGLSWLSLGIIGTLILGALLSYLALRKRRRIPS